MGGFSLVGKPAVEGEAGAGAEGDEEVVDAKGGADAGGEEGEQEVEGEEGGGVNVGAGLREAEEAVRGDADDDADEEAQRTLPEDGGKDPLPDCFPGS